MKAGFIGTGSMGLPLAANLLDQEKLREIGFETRAIGKPLPLQPFANV